MTASGADASRTLRLFVACELPQAVRDVLSQVQDDLRRAGAPRLRWVRPEGIHITLKFLGEVERERVPVIAHALADMIEPFRIETTPKVLGSYGGARIRVVSVGLEGGAGQLAELARRVDDALAAAGFDRERRPFSPHLTLARVPDRLAIAERAALAALVRDFRLRSVPPMILTAVSLMQSTLSPGGSVYRTVGEFPVGF